MFFGVPSTVFFSWSRGPPPAFPKAGGTPPGPPVACVVFWRQPCPFVPAGLVLSVLSPPGSQPRRRAGTGRPGVHPLPRRGGGADTDVARYPAPGAYQAVPHHVRPPFRRPADRQADPGAPPEKGDGRGTGGKVAGLLEVLRAKTAHLKKTARNRSPGPNYLAPCAPPPPTATAVPPGIPKPTAKTSGAPRRKRRSVYVRRAVFCAFAGKAFLSFPPRPFAARVSGY